ncbi:MAG TPA: transcription antitermination factor NusB [Acidimicrobiia bacterium]|nr:transcription antitermination factor NusB [Acidimicrobiia bacterium]
MNTPEDPPREPRDLALTALYEADQRGLHRPEIDPSLPAKAARLIQGVGDHLEDLDVAIDTVSTRWRVARMPPVDRAILRLGLYELRYEPKTPMAVVVSEAVRLARVYSTERSGAFVNGILSKLAGVERPAGLPEAGNPPSP